MMNAVRYPDRGASRVTMHTVSSWRAVGVTASFLREECGVVEILAATGLGATNALPMRIYSNEEDVQAPCLGDDSGTFRPMHGILVAWRHL